MCVSIIATGRFKIAGFFIFAGSLLVLSACTPFERHAIPSASAQVSEQLPVFHEPTWGEPLKDISTRYPNGKVLRIADGETHYRALAQAYGQPVVLVTFCFRNGLGLHFLVVDFPRHGEPIVVETEDFVRPTVADGQIMHQEIATDLENVYGPASHISGRPENGGLMVFGRQHGVTVRLDSKQIDQDQLNLTVWHANRATDIHETDEDRALASGMWRTDASTWSDIAVFDVNWGMGPGDVRDKYRGLTDILISPHDAVQSYDTNALVAGRVGIDFEFLKGRLVGFKISPWFYSRDDGALGAESKELMWAGWDLWKEEVIEILIEKYGPPRSGHVQYEYAEPIEPDSPANAWIWRTESSAIRLSLLGRVPILEYRELDSAEAHEKAKRDQEEQEKKALSDKF